MQLNLTIKYALLVSLLIHVHDLSAQRPVTIPIITANNALAVQTDKENRLRIIYFGKRLTNDGEYATLAGQYKRDDNNKGIADHAYTPSGTWNLLEPAIQVVHADGNTSLELKYTSHEVKKVDDNITVTSIKLSDPLYPFEVTLYYKTWPNENIVEQWSEIRHTEKKAVVLHKYASANLYFTGHKFFLHHYHGAWAEEMKPQLTELTAGIKSLDSKLGTRANLFQPPSFALSFDSPAGEDEGKVMLATLSWSGNFKIDFEKDPYGQLRLIAGINPFSSAYTLQPGETFVTPGFIYTYSENGKGEASRNLHRWARKYRVRNGEGNRLTLLNNWEATYFDFDEQKLTGLFAQGKKLGVDLFLLDDGWFGNKYPRNNDEAGLGDWQENKKKLPHGLGYLVGEASKAGLKFGIWVEPEMVNPKSERYEKHLDWVLREPKRPEHYFRNQLVLDLSNPAVQDFVFGVIDSLFTKNKEIAYIKWDCNAVIYNAHSMYLEKKKIPQTNLYVAYVKGLYYVLARVREKYPAVPMMLCSGGGGRVDYESLKYFTEFWPSDNTDPLERVFMQWEYSYFFPAIATCNHVTNWSRLPIKYKTDVAMMGKPGFDIVVEHLSEADLEFCQKALSDFKTFNKTVWHGDLYRLVDPRENSYASLAYVNSDRTESVMFNYLTNFRYNPTPTGNPVRLKGLDPAKQYSVQEVNLYPGAASAMRDLKYSGDFLMKVGINPVLSQSRSSVVLRIVEVK